MYDADGTYAWTRVFGTANGTAVTTQGIIAAVTADRIGNVFIASQFTGTVAFDGSAGSDTRTAAIQNGFLTSFHTFVPNSSIGQAAAIDSTTSNQLTNTGVSIATISIVAGVILSVSISVRMYPGGRISKNDTRFRY